MVTGEQRRSVGKIVVFTAILLAGAAISRSAAAQEALPECPPEQFDPQHCREPEPPPEVVEPPPPEAPPEEPEDRRGRRFLLPSLRYAGGASIEGGDERSRFSTDVVVGAQFVLVFRPLYASLLPEVGYSYHAHPDSPSHFASLGLSISFGHEFISVAYVTAFLIGSSDDGRDVRYRNGGRIQSVAGLAGIELLHELGLSEHSERHSFRIQGFIDLGVVFMALVGDL